MGPGANDQNGSIGGIIRNLKVTKESFQSFFGGSLFSLGVRCNLPSLPLSQWASLSFGQQGRKSRI